MARQEDERAAAVVEPAYAFCALISAQRSAALTPASPTSLYTWKSSAPTWAALRDYAMIVCGREHVAALASDADFLPSRGERCH